MLLISNGTSLIKTKIGLILLTIILKVSLFPEIFEVKVKLAMPSLMAEILLFATATQSPLHPLLDDFQRGLGAVRRRQCLRADAGAGRQPHH